MATKMDDMKKTLEDLEREVTCEVCLEVYTDPKVLPCQHYYCRKCIVRIACTKNTFSCPNCRKKVKVDVDELPTAHHINRLKDLHAEQEKVLGGCKKQHGKKCPHHRKTLELYCDNCGRLICRDCIIIDHKHHDIQFINVIAKKRRKSIKKKLTSLTKTEKDYSDAIAKVKIAIADVKAQGEDVVHDINASFEELHAILEQRKKNLLKQVRAEVKDKTVNLQEQKHDLSVSSGSITSVIDGTRQRMQSSSDMKIVKMYEDLAETIEDIKDNDTSMSPVEKADIAVEVSCAEQLRELCKTNAFITRYEDSEDSDDD